MNKMHRQTNKRKNKIVSYIFITQEFRRLCCFFCASQHIIILSFKSIFPQASNFNMIFFCTCISIINCSWCKTNFPNSVLYCNLSYFKWNFVIIVIRNFEFIVNKLLSIIFLVKQRRFSITSL